MRLKSNFCEQDWGVTRLAFIGAFQAKHQHKAQAKHQPKTQAQMGATRPASEHINHNN